MKRIFLLFLGILISKSTAFACPFCGCANSNFQIGVLPTYNHAFAGVRYTYSEFSTLSSDKTQFSHDYFHSTELWGGYQIGRVQLMAFVPYVSSHKSGDDGIANEHGLGDVTLLGNYKVFATSVTNVQTGKTTSQNIMLGAGVKFHTGKSRVDVNDPDFSVGDFSATPGTGSTDILINAVHSYLSANHGLVTNMTYRINTANVQQFQYGNRLYVNAAYFYSISTGLWVFRPSMGLNYVVNGANRFQQQILSGSHGYILSGLAGVNVQRGKIGVLVNSFLPLSQNLFDHQTQFQSRGSIALTYSF